MNPRKLIALAAALLALLLVNLEVLRSERLLATGRAFYLELAPVDPRSLLQGDYMVLNYALANQLRSAELPAQAEGWVLATLDARGVAGTPQPLAVPPPALAPDQVLLKYRRDGWRVQMLTDAYFFEEGQGARYERARYGRFRTDDRGKALLEGLYDEQLQPL